VSAHSSTASVGSPAPDFTLRQVGGGEVTLSAFRGKPVVLVFLRGFA
jgi:peroxiredoxin